ncbi:MAG: hypothetical protein CENE_02441 [Candidatus Celerinatantimonas neptuna]|nr:MAG: hypothetical protein CENE_02441 [Candidatus Celerinatantimonas neptuna]
MKQVLFLCTNDDYYRSHLAEEYFNHWSETLNLPYHASSKALPSDLNKNKHRGSITHQMKYLFDHLTTPGDELHKAAPAVNYEELNQADYLFAMDKQEHQQLIEKYYPEFTAKCRYFTVDDEESVALITEQLMNQLDQWIAQLVTQYSTQKKQAS